MYKNEKNKARKKERMWKREEKRKMKGTMDGKGKKNEEQKMKGQLTEKESEKEKQRVRWGEGCTKKKEKKSMPGLNSIKLKS